MGNGKRKIKSLPLQNRPDHLQIVIRVRPVFSARPDDGHAVASRPVRNDRPQVVPLLVMRQLLPGPAAAAVASPSAENLVTVVFQRLAGCRMNVGGKENR